MNRERFTDLVEGALSELPPVFAERLENVAVVVEDTASPQQLAKVNVDNPRDLLGLYEGVPLTSRSRGYAGVLPDRISIFRIPILAISHSDEQIKENVRNTVMHELGHYFGMDEDRLRRVRK